MTMRTWSMGDLGAVEVMTPTEIDRVHRAITEQMTK